MNSWASDSTCKRRDKLHIIAEILDIARDGTLKTQIMYKANLSFTQLNEYLKFMLRTRLLDKFVDNGKEIYRTTQKGMNFLQRHQEITELLKTESGNCKNGVRIPPPNLLKRN